MDQLSYHYIDSTNQLEYVTDQVAASNYAEDIDGQNTNNYRYDEIGNLIAKGLAQSFHHIINKSPQHLKVFNPVDQP